MKDICIITAKANNVSIPNKNLIELNGVPILERVVESARSTGLFEEIFVSTNGEPIISFANKLGCKVIIEPSQFTNHGDAINFAIDSAEKMLGSEIGNVTILLGNTISADSESIKLANEILRKNKNLDSVMTVWQAQDDHPYRAMTIDQDGLLKSFLDVKVGTARQSYPSVFYYDQGPWTFRRKVSKDKEGPGPWWWMGQKCFPIVRNWVTGRDIHSILDVEFSKYWLDGQHQNEIMNSEEVSKLINNEEGLKD